MAVGTAWCSPSNPGVAPLSEMRSTINRHSGPSISCGQCTSTCPARYGSVPSAADRRQRPSDALYSADEHAQTSESPNMATATPSARRGPRRRRSNTPGARAGRAAIRRQHPSSPRGRRGRSLPRCGELTFRTPTRHRAPNQQPGRILIPGGGAAGDQEAQNRPVYATPAACPVSMTSWRYGLRRACRLVTRRSHRPRSTWPNQARLAFLAVTHRYKRTHCLWLEQFQITMRCPLMVRRGRPSGAERSVLAPSLLRCNSFAERRHRGEQGEPRCRKPRNAAGAFPGSRSVSRRDMLVSS